jgi:alpha-beta hydrolase superfamily lysophospholipase
VFGIDYEGHGKSMGARCYIHKFDSLVADCDRFFKSICGENLPAHLFVDRDSISVCYTALPQIFQVLY